MKLFMQKGYFLKNYVNTTAAANVLITVIP